MQEMEVQPLVTLFVDQAGWHKNHSDLGGAMAAASQTSHRVPAWDFTGSEWGQGQPEQALMAPQTAVDCLLFQKRLVKSDAYTSCIIAICVPDLPSPMEPLPCT